jgi:hypothetical protein
MRPSVCAICATGRVVVNESYSTPEYYLWYRGTPEYYVSEGVLYISFFNDIYMQPMLKIVAQTDGGHTA